MHARVKTNGGMVVIARFETLPRRKRRPHGSVLDMGFWSIFLKHMIFSKKTEGDGVKNPETFLRHRPKICHFWDTAGYQNPSPPYISPPPHSNNSTSINNLASHLEGARQAAAVPVGRKGAMIDLFESDHQANEPESEVNHERQRVLGD